MVIFKENVVIESRNKSLQEAKRKIEEIRLILVNKKEFHFFELKKSIIELLIAIHNLKSLVFEVNNKEDKEKMGHPCCREIEAYFVNNLQRLNLNDLKDEDMFNFVQETIQSELTPSLN